MTELHPFGLALEEVLETRDTDVPTLAGKMGYDEAFVRASMKDPFETDMELEFLWALQAALDLGIPTFDRLVILYHTGREPCGH